MFYGPNGLGRLAAGGCKHLIGVGLFPPAVILDKCNDRVAKAPALIGLPALPFLAVEETQPAVALFALNLISLLETCGPSVEHRGKGLLTRPLRGRGRRHESG